MEDYHQLCDLLRLSGEVENIRVICTDEELLEPELVATCWLKAVHGPTPGAFGALACGTFCKKHGLTAADPSTMKFREQPGIQSKMLARQWPAHQY